ncbi:MAG: endonuclease III [Paludibacteraceae bacterium]|nr:endonuclease III [Paludibacteraceae bacterium]
MTVSERYAKVLAWFQANMRDAESELNFRNPYELLVAVMLSAQCTDKRVNMVTPAFFERFPDAFALSEGTFDDVLTLVKSISYPNSKAEHILSMAKMVVSDFKGKIPCTMEELTRLPGVGRKTANVMLTVAFGQPAMPVDTHVFRVSNRIGLTNQSKTPEQTEKILVKHIPHDILGNAHHWLLLHGRYVCTAKNPKCGECGIREWCKSKGQSS